MVKLSPTLSSNTAPSVKKIQRYSIRCSSSTIHSCLFSMENSEPWLTITLPTRQWTCSEIRSLTSLVHFQNTSSSRTIPWTSSGISQLVCRRTSKYYLDSHIIGAVDSAYIWEKGIRRGNVVYVCLSAVLPSCHAKIEWVRTHLNKRNFEVKYCGRSSQKALGSDFNVRM